MGSFVFAATPRGQTPSSTSIASADDGAGGSGGGGGGAGGGDGSGGRGGGGGGEGGGGVGSFHGMIQSVPQLLHLTNLVGLYKLISIYP
jgi:hypothetical protein